MERVLRAGRWLWATYGRFIRLSAVCIVFLVASELVSDLAFRVSHAAMVGLALGILVLASLFIRRDLLKSGWRRAQHRHPQQSV
jgi:hypothetical protein